MTLTEVQQLCQVTKRSGVPTAELLAEYAMGLCGESGEVSEIVKKHLFQGKGLDKAHLTEEIGDVMWYLSNLATSAGITLEDAVTANNKKLTARYPDRASNGSQEKP